MSIQDSGGPISYADHDVQHINHTVANNAGSGGDNVRVDSVEEFEVTERGLDPDELAELRAMRVNIGCVAHAGQPQDSRGEFRFAIDAGFNIGTDDGLHQQDSLSTQFDPDGDSTNEVRSLTQETDEVGQVYSYSDTYGIGFDDDTNGNGAGGHNNAVSEVIDLNGLFGSGPYVDSVDDFVSVVKAEPENIVEFFGVSIDYSLYYDVNEVEGGRSRFGR